MENEKNYFFQKVFSNLSLLLRFDICLVCLLEIFAFLIFQIFWQFLKFWEITDKKIWKLNI